MQPIIHHIGQYTRAETYVQKTEDCHIGIILSGLDYMNFTVPGRDALLSLPPTALPCLMLLPPGINIDFRFGRHRENWAVLCELKELTLDPGKMQSRLQYGEISLEVPFSHSISSSEALAYREHFAWIQTLWLSGAPADRLAAELAVGGVLAKMAAVKSPQETGMAETPAARFRSLIDHDRKFQKTLAELSRECGAGAGYLRKCFRETYRIEPGEYRARRRMGRICELLSDSTLGLKEIAEQVGMRHVTHLNLFIRERCGVTPGELRKSRQSSV